MNAKQVKMPDGSLLAAITKAVAIGEQVKQDNADLIATIKEQAAKQVDAKNVADAASTERKGLWTNVLMLAEHVAAAAPTKDTREMVFNIVAADLLEGETANTAKMYASTARSTLIKLHTEQGLEFSDLQELSYGDVRKLLKPDANPEGVKRNAELNKRLKFIIRKGDKAETLALLGELESAVEPLYNKLKQKADSDSAAAKAAKELENNRQQQPDQPAVTETVAKPEAIAA